MKRQSLLTIVLFGLVCLILFPISVQAQEDYSPVSLREDIQIEHFMNVAPRSIRLVKNDISGHMYYNTSRGDIYRVLSPGKDELMYTSEDHGITRLQGITFYNGDLYLSGNVQPDDGIGTKGRIMRATVQSTCDRVWTVVAETVKHVSGQHPFDHGYNDIVVNQEGTHLLVSSGSITDHGEIHDSDGRYPGQREVPTTAVILKLPIDGQDILLTHDKEQLKPYLFVRGVRNVYSFAYAPNGHFFGVSNSGDYDHSEDMFWLRDGHHYGFPWIMGGTKNPQQFPDFAPDPATDPGLNRFAHAVAAGFFHNDPDFPQIPENVVITPSVQNIGPDANYFRDLETGEVMKGDEVGKTIGTFTAHRSPLGLVFDHEMALPNEFRGDGFVLSWTPPTTALMAPFHGHSPNLGEDLMHLKLFYSDIHENYIVQTTRIAENFSGPTDALLVGNELYVIEHTGSASGGSIWKVTFK